MGLMRHLGVENRPQHERLDRLCLAGCGGVDCYQLEFLDTCVKHDRKNDLPFAHGPFDLWRCEHCWDVVGKGVQCLDCKSMACVECASWSVCVSVCWACDAPVCLLEGCGYHGFDKDDDDDLDEMVSELTHCSCAECGARFCEDCYMQNTVEAHGLHTTLTCIGDREGRYGCFRVWCGSCVSHSGNMTWCWGKCHGFWCESCCPEMVFYGSSMVCVKCIDDVREGGTYDDKVPGGRVFNSS
jgi:hypothetical protein